MCEIIRNGFSLTDCGGFWSRLRGVDGGQMTFQGRKGCAKYAALDWRAEKQDKGRGGFFRPAPLMPSCLP